MYIKPPPPSQGFLKPYPEGDSSDPDTQDKSCPMDRLLPGKNALNYFGLEEKNLVLSNPWGFSSFWGFSMVFIGKVIFLFKLWGPSTTHSKAHEFSYNFYLGSMGVCNHAGTLGPLPKSLGGQKFEEVKVLQ